MSSAVQVEPGLPRAVARQPPGGDETDQVHDAVPVDAQRSEPEIGPIETAMGLMCG